MTRASDTAKLLGAGATILDGTTISTADNTAQVTLVSTDADATSGPLLHFQRNSSSPADSDNMGRILFDGKNDADEDTTYVEFQLTASDVSDGSEDASFQIGSKTAGSFLSRVEILPTETVLNEDSADIDFRVESNGNANMLTVNGGSDLVGIGADPDLGKLHIKGSDTSASVSAQGNLLVLEDTENGLSILSGTSGAGYIFFGDSDDNNVGILIYDHSANAFRVYVNAAERMRLTSDGQLLVGCTASGANEGLTIKPNNSNGACTLFFDRASSTSSSTVLNFENGNQTVGSIAYSNGGTSFNTSSDYRLKENVTTSWDATTRLKQLKPARFNFIADADKTVDGFLAHEVSSIVPEAITGEKDATEDIVNVVLNADGTINCDGVSQSDWTAGKSDETYASDTTWVASKTVPKYQGIDQSKLVPLLVKTIQELEARITTLENA